MSQEESKIKFVDSIKGRLLFYFLALSLIPLGIVIGISYLQAHEMLHEIAYQELEKMTELQAEVIQDWNEERLLEMEVLAQGGIIRAMDGASQMPYLKFVIQKYERYENIFVINSQGMTISIVGAGEGKEFDLSERDYFKKAIRGETNFSDILISKASGNPIFVVATPILSDGEIIGVMGGSVSTASINQMLQASELGQTGEAYLINSEGYFITPSRFADELKSQGLITERAELELKVESTGAQDVLVGNASVGEYLNYRGTTVLGAYRPIENSGWSIIVEQGASTSTHK